MALQNEYDAIVFETLELRKQYDTVRQDLANALYTNDASMRVIARLMKERDEAREALSSVQTSLGMPSSSGAHEDVEMTQAANPTMNSVTSLPVNVMEQIDSTAAALTKDRRARIKRGGSEGVPHICICRLTSSTIANPLGTPCFVSRYCSDRYKRRWSACSHGR